MSNENDDIRSISFDKLNNFIQKNNFPSYRSNQIFNWINKSTLRSFDDMTNIPKSLVKLLKENLKWKLLIDPELEFPDSRSPWVFPYLFLLDEETVSLEERTQR